MEDDYYSIDSILSENQVLVSSSMSCMCIYPTFTQKIQCTFKVDIPDMGHLDGGRERDVCPAKTPCTPLFPSHPQRVRRVRSKRRAKSSCPSGSPSSSSIRACVGGCSDGCVSSFTHHSLLLARDYADFTVPPPFSSRVRNALDAESKSVRLSALVGAGGLWYGFGKIIMRL
jgi:GINS complex subunit 3